MKKIYINNIPLLNIVQLLILATTIFLFINCTSKANSQTSEETSTLRWGKVYTENDKVVLTVFKTVPFWNEESDYYDEFKIYRVLYPDFTFNIDYEEYFYNVGFKEENCIFKGNLDSILGTKFKFEDATAKKDSVYAYWIASSDGIPVGPLPVKVRDTEVWWSYEKITNRLKDLKKTYPEYMTLEKIGYSVSRKPLYGLKIGKGRPSIALIGAIHPGESGPELIIPTLEKLLEKHQDLLESVSVISIPSVNCDIREKLVQGNPWYLRRNKNGVDLNRNFPSNWEKVEETYKYYTSDPDGLTYRGPYAASEPETQALMNFLMVNKPLAVFSCHHLASICGETLLAAKTAKNDSNYKDLSYKYANLFWNGTNPNMEQQRISFACSNGSLASWCYQELGIPAFDVEGPIDTDDSKISIPDRTNLILLEKYQKKYFNAIFNILDSL